MRRMLQANDNNQGSANAQLDHYQQA